MGRSTFSSILPGAVILLSLLLTLTQSTDAAVSGWRERWQPDPSSSAGHVQHLPLSHPRARIQQSIVTDYEGKQFHLKARKAVPHGWKVDRQTPVPNDARIRLHVALRHTAEKAAHMEELFWNVSTPSNPSYGHHLSVRQLRGLVRPSQQQLDAVRQWLEKYGVRVKEQSEPHTWDSGSSSSQDKQPNADGHIAHLSYIGDELIATLPITLVESLLHTRYEYYVHAETGMRILRCPSYALPRDVADHIAFVGPTIHMVDAQSMRRRHSQRAHSLVGDMLTRQRSVSKMKPVATTPSQPKRSRIIPDAVQAQDRPACDPYVDIPCLNYIYALEHTYGTFANNSQCATGFHDQWIDDEDITDFLEWQTPSFSRNKATVIGPNDPSQPGGEAIQDIQLLMGIAPGVPTYFISTGGRQPHGPDADEPFFAFFSALVNAQEAPLVVSTSYGDDELDLDMDYVVACNAKFQQSGLRGVSVLFASGDGGVAGGHGIEGCTDFVAVFPGASPFLTSVGGTKLDAGNLYESGAEFSSGGFSNYFKQPAYQTDAVAEYLKNSAGIPMPPADRYNTAGRAFPDVSAMSLNLPTVIHGSAWPTMGTSCSSPIFGATLALLNDFLLSQGKSSMGFINPWLYTNYAKLGPNNFLNDVVAGNNPGCGTDGFQATTGWDPVTGLGTPNLKLMMDAIKQQHH